MKYFFAILILLSFSCKEQKKNKLPQEWYKIQEGFNDEDSSGNENTVLRLYDDGTYAQFAANFYNFGTWKWKDTLTRLILTPTNGKPLLQKQMWQVTQLINDKLEVQQIMKQNTVLVRDKRKITFFYNEHNESAADPFSYKNNIWRIKPTQPENEQQIKTRTVQYLNFLKDYYQHAIDNKFSVMTFGWYPAPLQMHFSNGARMAYNTELNDWYACFYNEQQAVEAYKLISGTMSKVKIKAIESKAERNLDLILQILKVIG